MLWGVLWIIIVYAAATASLHWSYRISRYQLAADAETAAKSAVVFALVTRNNGAEIEWYLRSLIFVSWLRGRNYAILVFDEDSTDDTVAIVKRMAAEGSYPAVKVAEVALEEFLAEHIGAAVVVRSIIAKEVMQKGEGCIIR